MILWTLCGVGVFLIYAAYKNLSPQKLLIHHLTSSSTDAPLTPNTAAPIPVHWGTETASNSVPQYTGNPTPQNPGVAGTANLFPDSPVYTTAADISGQYNVIGPSGMIIAAVPGAYQSTANTYIPPAGVIT